MINKQNYLLLLEGEKTEFKLIEKLLASLGFIKTLDSFKSIKNMKSKLQDYKYCVYEKNSTAVHIIKSVFNDIETYLDQKWNAKYDLNLYFGFHFAFISIFLIHDFEQRTIKSFKECYEKFNNIQSGLWLVSIPCIEVLASKKSKPFTGPSNVYKKRVTINMDKLSHYLIDNIEKNSKNFSSFNVDEHPNKLYEEIITKKRDNLNNYFATVFYVFLAEILKLNRLKNNSQILMDEIEKYLK